jgi:hypothetical protein
VEDAEVTLERVAVRHEASENAKPGRVVERIPWVSIRRDHQRRVIQVGSFAAGMHAQ